MSIGNDLNAEDIGKAWATVVTKGAKDEVLALLVEDENPGEHGDDVEENKAGVDRELAASAC